MNARHTAIVACLWIAAGSSAATASPSPSPESQSLEALWGAKLLHAVVIADVASGSIAAQAGLRAGDVLESYDRTGVDDFPTVEEFVAGLRSAARKGAVAAKIRRFEGEAGPPGTLTVELRLPAEPEARLGLALHPGVFFLNMLESGVAARAGVKPWDCIDGVEGESLAERPRLGDFEAHVQALRNRDGNVRVTVGRWRPAGTDAEPKIALVGMREVVLPVPSR